MRLDGVGDVPAKLACELRPGDITRWHYARGPANVDGYTVVDAQWVTDHSIRVTYRQNRSGRTETREHRKAQLIGIYTLNSSSEQETSMRAFLRDRRAVTALEYGLIAALVAVVIITSVTALGVNLSTTFQTIAASI